MTNQRKTSLAVQHVKQSVIPVIIRKEITEVMRRNCCCSKHNSRYYIIKSNWMKGEEMIFLMWSSL